MATQRRRRRNIPVTVAVAVNDVTLEAGETAAASYSIVTQNGVTRTSGFAGDFTSSTAAATVDADTGVVTAADAGTPAINFSAKYGVGGGNSVVDASPITVTTTFTPDTVNVTLADATLAADETTQATATVTNTLAVSKTSGVAGTWASSDTDVATVDSSGVVTAVATGTCTINFTTTSGSKTDASPPTLTVS